MTPPFHSYSEQIDNYIRPLEAADVQPTSTKRVHAIEPAVAGIYNITTPSETREDTPEDTPVDQLDAYSSSHVSVRAVAKKSTETLDRSKLESPFEADNPNQDTLSALQMSAKSDSRESSVATSSDFASQTLPSDSSLNYRQLWSVVFGWQRAILGKIERSIRPAEKPGTRRIEWQCVCCNRTGRLSPLTNSRNSLAAQHSTLILWTETLLTLMLSNVI